MATKKTVHDPIKRPSHYARYKIEPIDFIMENGLDFATGNIIKYVCRQQHKNGLEDLKKAAEYLRRLIEREAKKATKKI